MQVIYAKPQGNIEIIQQFQRAGVSFLVIGSAAVAFHGCRNWEKVNDLDLMVDQDIENARKVVFALHHPQIARYFQMRFTAEDLASPGKRLPIRTINHQLDILTPVPNFHFAELFERSVCALVDNTLGRTRVRVVSKEDMVKLKENTVLCLNDELDKHEQDLERLRNVVKG